MSRNLLVTAAKQVSAFTLLMSTTALTPALADCTTDTSSQSYTCTGDVAPINLTDPDPDIISITVKDITSTMTDTQGASDYIILDQTGVTADRTITLDMNDGYSLESTNGGIRSVVSGAAGKDNSSDDNTGFDTQYGTDGGNGSDAGSLTISISGTQVNEVGAMLAGGPNSVLNLQYSGGNGGGAGEGHSTWGFHDGYGGTGGNGGKGGNISVTFTEDAGINYSNTSGGNHDAVHIVSTGGNGGNGGTGRGNLGADGHGGTGGNGGDGGDVSLIATSTSNFIDTNSGNGITLVSRAGRGGNGGKAIGSGVYPGDGGSGGNGGTVSLQYSGYIFTHDANQVGIFAQSSGGSDGTEGSTGGWVAKTHPASAGDPGQGGEVTVTLSDATIATEGAESFGILAQSIGGFGGDASSSSGIDSYGAGGGSGGAGNTVSVSLTDSKIYTYGEGAIGVIAVSVGGGGGTGGADYGITALGGYGGAGGDAGDASVTLDGTTIHTKEAYSEGITVLSIGGGGGNSGTAGGISTTGASGGSGGSGGKASFTSHGGSVTTEGDEAMGVAVMSVGGGGGNSHSTVGVETVGASGGNGGNGGEVTYSSDGDGLSISTSGKLSFGILLLSAGRGGGSASSTFTLSAISTSKLGASGADGGSGGDITFALSDNDTITTTGDLSPAFAAISVGGGGGTSGNVVTVDVINTDTDAGVVQKTGSSGGGSAGNAGNIIDSTLAGTISTSGNMSAGAMLLSVGGGGGMAGSHVTTTFGATLGHDVGVDGGDGGDGGTISFSSSANITTTNSASDGIVAMSVGGGGGHSSIVVNATIGDDASSLTSLSSSLGSSGGTGGDAGDVTVTTTDSSSITTKGHNSTGLLAMSVAGVGGKAGTVISGSVGGISVATTTGSSGGDGGTSGAVTVNNAGGISTEGYLSSGIVAASVAGGGGDAGTVIDGTASTVSVDTSYGGSGGAAGNAGTVSVTNSGKIETQGDQSRGILALSVGSSGGSGGTAIDGSVGFGSITTSVGGNGGGGGKAENVTVNNTGDISTTGDKAAAIEALSIGGSGGTGGLTVAGSGDGGLVSGSVDIGVGGGGGSGGDAGDVQVTSEAAIKTTGYGSPGVIAQSVGGSGGDGGASVAGAFDISEDGDATINVSVGGEGGASGTAGDVTVKTSGSIKTEGDYSYGIQALSIGGNGGTGGSSYSGSFSGTTGTNIGVTVSVGGEGGDGAVAGNVTVENISDITTTGGNSHGIYAQSIGGNGGDGGSGVAYLFDFGNTANSKASFTGNVLVGGSGGSGNHAGDVHITNSGTIDTKEDTSYGIYAQSVGGGGGDGGNAGAFTVGYVNKTEGSDALELSYSFSIGTSGGSAGDGGSVTVENAGTIKTKGLASYGIFAQSIGGTGGNGGNGSVDAKGWVADVYDAYENVNSIKEQYEQLKEAGESIASLLTKFSLSIGGSGGAASDGGDVSVTNTETISTEGDSATAIYAQSVGGGGGSGGDGEQGLLTSLAVVGSSKGGGNGGTVNVENSGTITTKGDGAMGIYAQSLGGGGGTGGDIEGSIVHQITDLEETLGAQVFGDADGGDGGNGGNVTITVDKGGSITTSGENAHGIWAQSTGGGGGAQGELGTDTDDDDSTSASIGSYGAEGDSGLVDISVAGSIDVTGDGSVGIFAQSASGGTASSASAGVRVTVSGSVSAGGANGRAILVQADGVKDSLTGLSGTCESDTSICAGTSHVYVKSGATVETTSSSAYETIGFLSGQQNYRSDGTIYLSNLLENAGTIKSADSSSVVVANDGTASLRIHNMDGGLLSGSIKLGDDYRNEFENNKGAIFAAGDSVYLGKMGYFTGNAGSTTSAAGEKKIGSSTFSLGGSYTELGTIFVDAGLDSNNEITNDLITYDGLTDDASFTFSGTVKGNWVGTTNLVNGSSGSIKIITASDGTTYDVSGATVSDGGAVSYSLSDESDGLYLSYSVDYSGAASGATLSRNALNYASYFNAAITKASEESASNSAALTDLELLATEYLNTNSASDLQKLYLQHVPEESMIGAVNATKSALSLHSILQSCPEIDPAHGDAYLRQQDCNWVQFMGKTTHQKETSTNPAYDQKTYGMSGAIQREIDAGLFVEFGGHYEAVQINGTNFTHKGNRYSFGVALKKEIGNVTLSSTLGAGGYSLDYNRGYSVSGTSYVSNSDIDGRFLTLEGRVSAIYPKDGNYLKPSAALSLTRLWQDGFTEEGEGSQNWQVDALSKTSVILAPSLEAGRIYRINGMAASTFIRGGLSIALTDPETTMVSTLDSAGSEFGSLTSTLAADRLEANLGIGFKMDVAEGMTLSFQAEAGASENTTSFGGLARFEYRF